METPAPPPPRCQPCGKRIYETHEAALFDVVRLRMENGYYREEYRCPGDALGGWHLRDLRKRYEKVRRHNSDEADELLRKIRRLDDVLPKDADRSQPRKSRRSPVENALRKLPPGRSKPMGRRGTLRRAQRDRREDGEARARGTRGTSVTNELRRKQARARLREELLREEKEID